MTPSSNRRPKQTIAHRSKEIMTNSKNAPTQASCPICASCSIVEHTYKEPHRTVKCTSCGILFTVGLTQEQLIKFYDSSYFKNDSIMGYKDYVAEEKAHRQNARRLLATVNRRFPLHKLRVLDVGCAAGFLLDEARIGYSCDVVGVEPASTVNSVASNRLGITVHSCPLEDADLAPDSFHAVFLIGTIEHLLNPRSVVTAIQALLKPGGALVITTIDTNGLIPLYSIKPPEHIFYFSHSNIRMLLKQCGYENIEHHMHFASYRPADIFHRLHEFSGFSLFGFFEKISSTLMPNTHMMIPTNEMLIFAQKNSFMPTKRIR